MVLTALISVFYCVTITIMIEYCRIYLIQRSFPYPYPWEADIFPERKEIDMNHTIINECLKATFSSKGGDILSVIGNDGTEYMWQGNPAYWGGHAPQLFPFIGRLTDGKYYMDGTEHTLRKHGFLRDSELNVIEKTDTSVTFSLKSSTETLKEYDRSFEARLKYTLNGKTLDIEFTVINNDIRTMYFAYGGHPGFNVPLTEGSNFEDYYLEFDTPGQPVSIGLSPSYFVGCNDAPFSLENDRQLTLYHELFDDDAIILRNGCRSVTLRSKFDSHTVSVSYPRMQYLGIWHTPHTDAPFVCIEPWTSLPSHQDVVDTFEGKHDLEALAPGRTYVNHWSITFA